MQRLKMSQVLGILWAQGAQMLQFSKASPQLASCIKAFGEDGSIERDASQGNNNWMEKVDTYAVPFLRLEQGVLVGKCH